MENEKTVSVAGWHELADIVENMNPHKQTIVLSGWINELVGDKTRVKRLIFTTKPVGILHAHQGEFVINAKFKSKGKKNGNNSTKSKKQRKTPNRKV